MKAMQINVEDKEYILGFFTRADAKRAEQRGLRIAKIDEQMITQSDKLIYTSLLAKQPEITEEQANVLIDKFVEEGIDLKEIIEFLAKQLTNFMQSPAGKNKKKIKIIEM